MATGEYFIRDFGPGGQACGPLELCKHCYNLLGVYPKEGGGGVGGGSNQDSFVHMLAQSGAPQSTPPIHPRPPHPPNLPLPMLHAGVTVMNKAAARWLILNHICNF